LTEILDELDEFYTQNFPEYLDAFRRAAEETLEAIAKSLKP
jgi:hypothetical protein